jgi:hypothetical protein
VTPTRLRSTSAVDSFGFSLSFPSLPLVYPPPACPTFDDRSRRGTRSTGHDPTCIHHTAATEPAGVLYPSCHQCSPLAVLSNKDTVQYHELRSVSVSVSVSACVSASVRSLPDLSRRFNLRPVCGLVCYSHAGHHLVFPGSQSIPPPWSPGHIISPPPG